MCHPQQSVSKYSIFLFKQEFDSKKKVTSDQFTPSLLLEFKEDTVRLDLPVSGITVENWKIQPLVPPRVSYMYMYM